MPASRFGFTLVELLVVIAIIGILVGLLLPAVNASRSSALQLQCKNNLKQLGVALIAYHGRHQALPPGNMVTNPGDVWPTYANWAILILPDLEQSPLANQYDHTVENWQAANAHVLETDVPFMMCPSDVDPNTDVVINGYARPVARSSYRGVGGRYGRWSGLTLFWDYSKYVPHLLANAPRSRGPLSAAGVNDIAPVNWAMIRDGRSRTMLVGEWSTTTEPNRRGAWGVSLAFFMVGSAGPYDAVRGVPDWERCVKLLPSGMHTRCNRAFASQHPGGMNFVYCDGHVDFMQTTIDSEIYQQLATIHGGT